MDGPAYLVKNNLRAMEAFAAQLDTAFARHGTAGLVAYLLDNSDTLKEVAAPAIDPPTCEHVELTEQPAVALTDLEFRCQHCGGFDVRDDTFVCMKTCMDCATSWYYMTDNATMCMDYDDMVKAREKVSEFIRTHHMSQWLMQRHLWDWG